MKLESFGIFFETLLEPTSSVLKILLICGQRKTETMRMRWDNINEEVWPFQPVSPKNHEEHLVILPDMAIEVLENLKPFTRQKQWVFASPKRKNKPLKGVARARKNIQKDSNVSDFTPHDLRRTVATYIAKLGVDRTVLGKILNHKGLAGDSQVTAIYDRHGYMDEKRTAMNHWASHLRQILEEKPAKIHKLGVNYNAITNNPHLYFAYV